MTRLRELAKIPTALGDVRTADERRADVMAALLLGGTDGENTSTQQGRPTTVHVVVPYEVLLGSDLSGELLGYGPIPAGLCREAAASTTAAYRRWIVGPMNDLIECSSTYVPNQALKDFITARVRTCRMPGCNRTAISCELDHRVDYDGGNTRADNLHALCPRHHHLKTETSWTVDRDPDGTTRWRTPTGRRFAKPPDPYPGLDVRAEPEPIHLGPTDPDPPP